MIDETTKKQMQNELIEWLRDSEKNLGNILEPDEFSIVMLEEWLGVTRTPARKLIKKLLKSGEVVKTRRIKNGQYFRRVKK